ncbi:DUF1018 domain-containing protein [Acinetobacter sp. ANC 3791]|nr:DUF1018 domain-containing protein [Acinetobacter sp. ANC 3791]
MQEAVTKANAKSGENRTISRRSIFDWMKAVDDAEQHKIAVISVLAPKQRVTQIPSWASELLRLWGQPQKPTLTVCLEQLPQYLDANVERPTYAQAYRFLNEKMGKVDVMRGRMGKRELKNIQPFIRRDTSLLLPTDVYTADGHCFDAEVAHPMHGKPFRPEITSIIDVATRRLVGWSVSLSESSWCVLDAIRMSATECGIPAIFYVDNGSGYKNDMLKAQGRGVMARLNTEVSHALDDDTYRDLLEQVTGKRSAKDLNNDELIAVLKRYEELGFTKPEFGTKPKVKASKDALIGKIEALLADADLHWNYAIGIAKKMFKKEALEFCSENELYRIVAALEYRKKRAQHERRVSPQTS